MQKIKVDITKEILFYVGQYRGEIVYFVHHTILQRTLVPKSRGVRVVDGGHAAAL